MPRNISPSLIKYLKQSGQYFEKTSLIKISDQFQSIVDSKFKEVENGKIDKKLET